VTSLDTDCALRHNNALLDLPVHPEVLQVRLAAEVRALQAGRKTVAPEKAAFQAYA
jgi:hypothetical protein